MSLFELSDDYQTLYDRLDEIDLESAEGPELFETFANTLEGIETEFDEKAEKIACFMECMDRAGKQKIERPMASLLIRNNAESLRVQNDSEFIRWAQASGHDDLIRYKDPEINKPALKKAVKEGLTVSGVFLENSRSLTIR